MAQEIGYLSLIVPAYFIMRWLSYDQSVQEEEHQVETIDKLMPFIQGLTDRGLPIKSILPNESGFWLIGPFYSTFSFQIKVDVHRDTFNTSYIIRAFSADSSLIISQTEATQFQLTEEKQTVAADTAFNEILDFIVSRTKWN